MSQTNSSIQSSSSSSLPVPVISLGGNFFLQHQRTQDIGTFMSTTYQSTSNNLVQPSLSQDGNTWANDTLKVAISATKGDFKKFYANKPMIFLEVFSNLNLNSGNKTGDSKRAQWIHPISVKGALNRINTNYGGGGVTAPFHTEWDFTTKDFDNTNIELNWQNYYVNNSIGFPKRLVDFHIEGNQFRYMRRRGIRANGNNVITNYCQAIRFRFAYIDPKDNRSVILGNPSDVLEIKPKWGLFNDGDYHIYDETIQFQK